MYSKSPSLEVLLTTCSQIYEGDVDQDGVPLLSLRNLVCKQYSRSRSILYSSYFHVHLVRRYRNHIRGE